jgi:hypothetical protein
MIAVSMTLPAAETARPWIVYWVLIAISIVFLLVGISILLFSDIPRFDQFLWASGLGIASALLASDNAKPRGDSAG